jgi:hypothetical protein
MPERYTGDVRNPLILLGLCLACCLAAPASAVTPSRLHVQVRSCLLRHGALRIERAKGAPGNWVVYFTRNFTERGHWGQFFFVTSKGQVVGIGRTYLHLEPKEKRAFFWCTRWPK